MKKTLTLLALLLISMGATAQELVNHETNDSDKITYEFYQEMTNEQVISNINEINISLKKFCKMQVGGEITMIVGTGITAASTLVHINNIYNNPEYTQRVNPGMVIGAAAAFTGYIVKMCAFSKINKIQIQGSSIVYKI